MKIIYDVFSSNMDIGNTYVAIGNFDGVHLGHKKLIEGAVNSAKIHGGLSVVFTFLSHPMSLTNGQNMPKLINTVDEKIHILESLGVDVVVLQNFTKEFSALSPEEFVEKVLKEKLDAREIFVGFNFGFGKNRAADAEKLTQLTKPHRIKVSIIPPFKIDGKVISSTLIRNHIHEGDLINVNRYLGEPYLIIGEVIHGKKLGRTMGFPTANLIMLEKAYLPYGIYGATLEIEGLPGEYNGVVNIGRNPTLKPGEKSIEIHILDFNRDIYGKKVMLRLIKHIRHEIKFSGMDELKYRINKDVELWREFLDNIEKGIDYGD